MTKTDATGATVLLPCPFCKGGAEFVRKGSARQSCIIACTDCGCRLETGEVWSSGERWNTRAVNRDSQFDAMVGALTQIDTLAVCTGVVNPAQHRNMLENIARIARTTLSNIQASK